MQSFRPAVARWFNDAFDGATPAQELGWPVIRSGRDALVTAPTGSGKTLAAFLVAIDELVRQAELGAVDGRPALPERVQVVYVSPLKALSNDVERNLTIPLEGIGEAAGEIRVALRTGDTPAGERASFVKRPPHILVTTPESLANLLTAKRSRPALAGVRTLIVDEIHALLKSRRGSHLALTMARLDHLADQRPTRIGLSATLHPEDMQIAREYLTGGAEEEAALVDGALTRELDIAIEAPPTDLQAVMGGDQWADMVERLAQLVEDRRTTLIFVNTRKLSEKLAHHLAQRLGEDVVGAHHGSLARGRRLAMEARLKAGLMRALVATASLELGIDIGSVDLVCQVGSPRSIGTFLQRVGRSGHAVGRVPAGRLFVTTRDELAEATALFRAVRAGRMDRLCPPIAPLDILGQHVVAEAACQEWSEDALFDLFRKAWPYRDLARESFDEVVALLSEGVPMGMGRAADYLHRDRVLGTLRGRRIARAAAIEGGGAIPDSAQYRVVAAPDGAFVGTVDEDFAIETTQGDVFVLGSTSWRILQVSRGVLRVVDAGGAPANMPFWLGEAPGRTAELSGEVSRLREELVAQPEDGRQAWLLEQDAGLEEQGARQLAQYVTAQVKAVGVAPTQTRLLVERFFDDAGGMQVVMHAPFGSRINRALGLLLRKRFCRSFDFELQAAALDDAVLLSLSDGQVFPEDALHGFLSPAGVGKALTQAVLATPIFTSRWRWNATRSLVILRQRFGKRLAPPLQRMRAEDLMVAVFPEQAGCQDNHGGRPVEIPRHPLVDQTMADCLQEALDIDGLQRVLDDIAAGRIQIEVKTTTEPSPFCHEVINARPYAFLDDAPLEERRAQAVALRRTLPKDSRDLAALDANAIARVAEEASPDPRDAGEAHDALQSLIALHEADAVALDERWTTWLNDLAGSGRVGALATGRGPVWFAAELQAHARILWPDAAELHAPAPLQGLAVPDREAALDSVLRAHLAVLPPLPIGALAQRLSLPADEVEVATIIVENRGAAVRGRFSPGATGDDHPLQICERRLLARIHRYTLDRLRKAIQPVTAQDVQQFLLRWQHVAPGYRYEGRRGLLAAIAQLQGFEAPAGEWESRILPSRVDGYQRAWLDELCLAGEVVWGRLTPSAGTGRAGATAATPITLMARSELRWLLPAVRGDGDPAVPQPESGPAADILQALVQGGAQFHDDLVARSGRLRAEVDEALRELTALGLVTADGFRPLRRLMDPAVRRRERRRRNARSPISSPFGGGGPLPAGRWSALTAHGGPPDDHDTPRAVAHLLLARYGVVFRSLIARESLAVPWREVLWALRREEDRGQVRGGRFVAGVYGEQFALPEAVSLLRSLRRDPPQDDAPPITLSAADPLNLLGVLTPGPKTPAIRGGQVTYELSGASAATAS